MLDVLRTLLLAGVGAIDLTDEKMRSIIDELIRRGELAADEARELTALWAAGARDRRDAIADRVKTAVDEALARHNVASHASVADLQARRTRSWRSFRSFRSFGCVPGAFGSNRSVRFAVRFADF